MAAEQLSVKIIEVVITFNFFNSSNITIDFANLSTSGSKKWWGRLDLNQLFYLFMITLDLLLVSN